MVPDDVQDYWIHFNRHGGKLQSADTHCASNDFLLTEQTDALTPNRILPTVPQIGKGVSFAPLRTNVSSFSLPLRMNSRLSVISFSTNQRCEGDEFWSAIEALPPREMHKESAAIVASFLL